MTRPTADAFFLATARRLATRTTCLRRGVGCVLVDARGHQLATGFNGVPSGLPHCNEGHPCPGAGAPSGTDLDRCLSVHAEVNALAQCADVWRIDTVYLTVSPCFACLKALISTNARRLLFLEPYPGHAYALDQWVRSGRAWELHRLTADELTTTVGDACSPLSVGAI